MCVWFISASLVAQSVKNLSAVQETPQVRSMSWEDPLEKEMATHSSILAGKSHGQRSLVGCSPWGCKESGMTERLTLTYITQHNVFKGLFIACVCAALFQSCPTFCDLMDCSFPGSCVHRILQEGILEWVAISFSESML